MQQREIKFRGKRIDNKQWVYGYYVISRARHEGWEESGCWFSIHVETSDLEEPSFYKVHPETVGQFTGLKDKNGNEIYEGDVVDYKFWHKHGRANIIFKDAAFGMNEWFGFIQLDVFKPFCSWGEPEVDCYPFIEIIGNIYQSGEAIEATKQ